MRDGVKEARQVVKSGEPTRRVFLEGAVAASLMVTMGTGMKPALADVSDGTSLPNGAAQFGRVVRAKSDLQVCWFCVASDISFVFLLKADRLVTGSRETSFDGSF